MFCVTKSNDNPCFVKTAIFSQKTKRLLSTDKKRFFQLYSPAASFIALQLL